MGVDLNEDIQTLTEALVSELSMLDLEDQVQALNFIRRELHEAGPFSEEPTDYVAWERSESVQANDYNPNAVAPPEMRLLEHSIQEDGYTQPIVTHEEVDALIVVDGFHRNRVGKESKRVRQRTRGYLPVVRIRAGREDKRDRMASTVRHNRARGVHGVESMTDLVAYLAKRWDTRKICKELGMDEDEVLRYRQVSGLAEMFKHEEFSDAWDIEDESEELCP